MRRLFLTIYIALVWLKVGAQEKVIHKYYNLEKYWDTEKVCRNPHKGWYVHYFDNGIGRYGNKLATNDYLTDFPGLNHIYLRLAWSYLEPEEGKFNWPLIDKEIERWIKQGYTISFRITCKEVFDIKYATPEWVRLAGANGKFLRDGNDWEPDYGDPIFLEKLEKFHTAFAARYDDKAWLEYVDIGSYGDWGEGHTAFSERREWPAAVIKKHIDIYKKYYKKATLVVSDDIVGSRDNIDGSREEIMQYLITNNITLRDDGVCVKWFADRFGESTLRNPEFFEPFWRTQPINLELEHFSFTIDEKTWKNGVPFEKAIEETHATYIGFHDYPREWLRGNRALAERFANRVGYWYFIRSVTIPEVYERGKKCYINIVFTNKGVAPAYHRYPMVLRFVNKQSKQVAKVEIPLVDNRKWQPGCFVGEAHEFVLPEQLAQGDYDVEVGLQCSENLQDGMIALGFAQEISRKEGFYKVAEVKVK